MDIPTELRQIIDADQSEQDQGMRLIGAHFAHLDASISFHINGAPSSKRNWRCDVGGYRESCLWPNWFPDLVLTTDHPTLWPSTEPYAELYFKGQPPDPFRLFGLLAHLHEKECGTWLPFHEVMNTRCDPDVLFSSSVGLLARGPERLIRLYQKAAADEGLYCYTPKSEPPRRRIEGRDATLLKALILGESFVIGEEFRFKCVEAEGNCHCE